MIRNMTRQPHIPIKTKHIQSTHTKGIDSAIWIQLTALIILFAFYAEKVPDFFYDTNQNHIPLTEHSRSIIAPSSQIDEQQINSREIQAAFEKSDIKGLTSGFLSQKIWIKIKTREASHGLDKNIAWFLEVDRANIDHIEAYYQAEDGLEKIDAKAPGNLFHEYSNGIFLLNHTALESDLYLQIENSNATIGFLSLRTKDNLLRKISSRSAALGMFIGAASILILYNFFMYLSMQQKVQLYYLFYTGSLGLLVTIETGHIGYLFSTEAPSSAKAFTPAFIGLSILFAALFARHFIETKNNWLVDKLLSLIVSSNAFFIVVALFIEDRHATEIMTYIAVPYHAILWAISAFYAIKGNRNALYYFLAEGVVLIGCETYMFVAFGILEPSPLTMNMMPVGIIAEALLLSFSLADKIKRAQKQVDLANQRTLDLMNRYSLELEDKVRERTRSLEDTQQELVMTQQMAAMGVLTAGIAHEINNPNNFVSAGLQNLTAWKESFETLLEELLSDDSDPAVRDMFRERFSALGTHLAGISSSSDNISTIVTGLRTITRLDEADMKDVDATDGMLQIMRFLRAGIGKGIDFTSLAPDRPKVLCYPAELNSAFMALMTNAIQAIRDREAATHGPVDGNIHLESHVIEERQGRFLHITLKDNGCGMSAKTLSKAFEPFFTTRGTGAGAGLGLSISRDTIGKHGGTLTLKSTLNQGSLVTIRLPVAVALDG